MIRGQAAVLGKLLRVQSKKRMEYMPGQMIVRVKPAAAGPQIGAGRLAFESGAAKAAPEAVSAPLEYLRQNAGLKSVTPIFSRRREQLERASMSTADRSRLAVLSSVADST